MKKENDSIKAFSDALKNSMQLFLAAAEQLKEMKAQRIQDADIIIQMAKDGIELPILNVLQEFNEGKVSESQLMNRIIEAMVSKLDN